VAFEVENPDYDLSPFTGMTRCHWVESGKFLLNGVFQHVKQFEDPLVFPKQSAVCYPRPNDPDHRYKAEEFEGLARTFMLAAPIITEHPDSRLNDFSIKEYYANQVLLASNPKSPRFVGKLSEIIREYGFRAYQHTAEGAALTISLTYSKSQIWDAYSRREKDQIASLISDFAHNRTSGHNWRFFNVIMLTFLKLNGYPIDETTLKDHMQHIMAFYVGDGWYRDGKSFDLYNPWAFHLYGAIWCSWYGYEHEPEIAQIIEERHNEFMKTYPLMFSRDGHQLMWGRSIIYRCAASSAFGAAFLLKKTPVDPGWSRRVASANILQFLTRDDVFRNHIPCIGFYSPFDALVQGYSCTASPFWMSKAYVALTLPENSPFWTARENNGEWKNLGDKHKSVSLKGPGLTITVHGNTGATELRPGKVRDNDPNYSRLVYNSAFLWESDSPEGATSMAYSIRFPRTESVFKTPRSLGFSREESGVIYRQCDIDDPGVVGRIDLADIILPGGVIRVDRLRLSTCHDLHLGHFGIPHINDNKPEIRTSRIDGKRVITASIDNRRVALVAVSGWDSVESMEHRGRNPESDESTVVYAGRVREEDYRGMDLLITVMLHRTDNSAWSEDELLPIEEVERFSWTDSHQPCGVRLRLKNGKCFNVDYGNIECDICY